MVLVRLVSACVVIGAMAGAANADPVTESFYARCVNENAYQMQSADLQSACGCMAPVLVSFLTPQARAQIDDEIRNNRSVSLSGSELYHGKPGDIARAAVRQCPAVAAAMYQQKCSVANAATPACQEMKAMIDQAQ